MKLIKKLFTYLKFLEKEKINAMTFNGRGFL